MASGLYYHHFFDLQTNKATENDTILVKISFRNSLKLPEHIFYAAEKTFFRQK
jgi:hypothetical protein